MIVEALLITAVAAFHFAIMPGCFGANLFVKDMVFSTEGIKNVNTFCVFGVTKFGAVICLNDLGRIAKVENCSFHKIHC